MLQKKLGQRIADLRKTRHLTQVQLAKAVGCSVEFLSLFKQVLYGTFRPTAVTAAHGH
jgi:transcriptional regulator with XRE-family HTH domain